MKIFLTANSVISIKDENGNRISIVIDNTNDFAKNLCESISDTQLFLCVCNDPNDFEGNDLYCKLLKEALLDIDLKFDNVITLDNRNISKSSDYLKNANVVYLRGGKLDAQKTFLDAINFKERVNNDAIIIGQSAGSMNLGDKVYQYPESIEEIGCDLWLNGLDYYKEIIIPHFRLEDGNKHCPVGVNLLEEYFLPESINNTLYGIPNGSYLVLEDGKFSVFGDVYRIENGTLYKLEFKNSVTHLSEIQGGKILIIF